MADGGSGLQVIGIGLDIVEVERIRQVIGRQPTFVERVFTPQEIAYCWPAEEHRFRRLAARFAAKEAALKALGIGLRRVKWTDVEVQRDALGAPSLRLTGRAAEVAAQRGVRRLLISLSHAREYAAAQVLALGEEQP